MSAADFPPFRPRPPWVTGDLQTLRNYLRQPVFDLSPFAEERLVLPMQDGSGDRLVGALNRAPGRATKPLVVLVHGLTGCAEGAYMRASALHLLRRGHPVLRLNLRGAGPTRALCRGQYHAGRSQDLRDAIAVLPHTLVDGGIFAVGYSLGGNMLLKYLAEQGSDGPVRAGAAVSAPIELKLASRRLMAPRNRGYHGWLLRRMKNEALATTGLAGTERAAILTARHVYDFDQNFVAPRNSFGGADDYYARASALTFLPRITVPTLLIHALDDPWIPGESYTRFAWRMNPLLVPLLPRHGGHVGFHGRGARTPWHDACLGSFFNRIG